MNMDIKEFKKSCLKNIGLTRQLVEGCEAANDIMNLYHQGQMRVWQSVYETLVREFPETHEEGD